MTDSVAPPSPAQPPGPRSRARRLVLRALASVSLLAAGAAVAWQWWLGPARTAPGARPDVLVAGGAGEPAMVARTLALRGIVLDERGLPLAGAAVQALAWSLRGPDRFGDAAAAAVDELARSTVAASEDLNGPAAGSEAGVAGSTSTGPGGLFLLLLPPGRYDLRIVAAGHAELLVQDQQPGQLLTIELEPGYTISGSLSRFSAGAEVVAEPMADVERRPTIRSRPDGQGRFTLSGLGLGPYRVIARDASGEQASAAPVRAGSSGLQLALLPRQMLTGLVLHARDASPIAGATVTLAGSGLWPPRTTVSDARGTYHFPKVPAGWYVLRAVREPDLASGFIEGVVVPAGAAPTEQTIVVERQPRAELEVRRAEDGTPVKDAQCSFAPFLPSVLALRGSTDARGRFPLGPVAPGRYALTVRAPGLTTLLEQEVRVDADGGGGQETVLLSVAMQPAAALEGVVTDDRGEPVAFAELFAVNQDGQAGPLARPGDAGVRQQIRTLLGAGGVPSQERAGRSDAAGRFLLDGLPAGEWNLLCLHITHLPALVGTYRLAAGQVLHDVKIRMEQAGLLRGRVVDGEGDPVLSAKVHFEDQASTATDAQGRFVLTGVRGEGRLLVQAGGFTPLQRRVRVEPGAGDGSEPLLLTLDPELTPFVGYVLGPDGEELPGATVVVQGAGGLTGQTVTGRSGSFRLTDPPPPPWTVTVSAPGAARWQRKVARLDGPLEVSLQAGGTLRLEVLEAGTYEPVARARIVLRGPETLHWTGGLGNGLLAIDQLTPGRYEVLVEARGFVSGGLQGVDVEDRRDPDPYRILLAPGGGLGGKVLDLDGAPLAGAKVQATSLESGAEGGVLTVRTDATGSFRLTPLAEGSVELTVEAQGYEPDVRTERVVAGEEFDDLEFRLMPR